MWQEHLRRDEGISRTGNTVLFKMYDIVQMWNYVRPEVITAVTKKNPAFWDIRTVRTSQET
jgi:hypothetical protein